MSGLLFDEPQNPIDECRTRDESLQDEQVESALEHLAIERMSFTTRHLVLSISHR
jgi:hypothetical protein